MARMWRQTSDIVRGLWPGCFLVALDDGVTRGEASREQEGWPPQDSVGYLPALEDNPFGRSPAASRRLRTTSSQSGSGMFERCSPLLTTAHASGLAGPGEQDAVASAIV